jgi:hypothetical protein
MSVEFTDILQLPKHKGKTVQQVYDTEPSYLLWLRDQKLAGGRSDYFDGEVLRALNKAIDKDKRLLKKFDKWTELSDGRFSPMKPKADGTTPAEKKDDEDVKPTMQEIDDAQAKARAYSGLWGSF